MYFCWGRVNLGSLCQIAIQNLCSVASGGFAELDPVLGKMSRRPLRIKGCCDVQVELFSSCLIATILNHKLVRNVTHV